MRPSSWISPNDYNQRCTLLTEFDFSRSGDQLSLGETRVYCEDRQGREVPTCAFADDPDTLICDPSRETVDSATAECRVSGSSITLVITGSNCDGLPGADRLILTSKIITR